MTGYRVMYNNISDKSIGCHATTRPSIPAPMRDVQAIKIPGRDASFYETDGIYSDIVIPVNFSFLDKDPSKWGERYRRIKNWILGEPYCELRFSDDDTVHYRVLSTRITTTERLSKRIGIVTAEFICEGYTYLNSGDTYISLADTINNAYDLCHPIYRVTGTGECTLTVNGNDFVLTVNGVVVVDTENFISYDATSGILVNTTVAGDYQDLWLQPGNNSLTITSGFTCDIMPQWRCL